MYKLCFKIFVFTSVFLCSCSSGDQQTEAEIKSEKFEKKSTQVIFSDLDISIDQSDNTNVFSLNGQQFTGDALEMHDPPQGPTLWTIKDGKIIKKMKYFETYEIEEYTEMKAGIQHGKSLTYFKNGTLSNIRYFDMGNPSGKWQTWNEQGNLVFEIEH